MVSGNIGCGAGFVQVVWLPSLGIATRRTRSRREDRVPGDPRTSRGAAVSAGSDAGSYVRVSPQKIPGEEWHTLTAGPQALANSQEKTGTGSTEMQNSNSRLG